MEADPATLDELVEAFASALLIPANLVR